MLATARFYGDDTTINMKKKRLTFREYGIIFSNKTKLRFNFSWISNKSRMIKKYEVKESK